MRTPLLLICLFAGVLASAARAGEIRASYERRLVLMVDFAIDANERAHLHLQDKKLCAYLHQMAQTNARQAEQMSPPEGWFELHTHFLLVVENVERALYYAANGSISKWRHHQKIVRKELRILEELARRAGIDLYRFEYR